MIVRHEFPHGLLLHGDCREGLATLPDESVHAVVTSPPYFALRSYDLSPDEQPHEIGREANAEGWLAAMVAVFREARRVLRSDGVLWLNCGEKYSDDSKWGGRSGGKNGDHAGQQVNRGKIATGINAGNCLGLPWRLALALQADGWIWRDTVVWHKPGPMPVPQPGTRWERCRVKGVKPDNLAQWSPCPGCPKCLPNNGWVLRRHAWRFTPSWEPVFMFTKTTKYFCDARAAAEKAIHAGREVVVTSSSLSSRSQSGEQLESWGNGKVGSVIGVKETRNPRNVRRIASGRTKEKHFAAFPANLVREFLKPSISPGGCCATCGAQYAPAIETEMVATRPGTDTKQQKGDENGYLVDRDDANRIGNRDPQRKVQRVKVLDYRPTCRCEPGEPARPVVADIFMGTGTVALVAEEFGADWIGCELSEKYCQIIARRVNQQNRQKKLFR